MSASKATSLSPKKKASLGSPDPVCFTSPKNFLSGSKKRRFTSQLTCEAQSLTVKLLTEHAIAPKRGSAGAAGYDLARCVPFNEATSELYRSAYDYTIAPKGRLAIKTDVAMALPEGTYGRVAPRSGLAVNSGIDVGGGVIDSDYRGPVSVVLFNHGDTEFQVKRGDRIAQLVIEVIRTLEVEVVEELPETERGDGGFGSTGVATDVTNTVENNE